MMFSQHRMEIHSIFPIMCIHIRNGCDGNSNQIDGCVVGCFQFADTHGLPLLNDTLNGNHCSLYVRHTAHNESYNRNICSLHNYLFQSYANASPTITLLQFHAMATGADTFVSRVKQKDITKEMVRERERKKNLLKVIFHGIFHIQSVRRLLRNVVLQFVLTFRKYSWIRFAWRLVQNENHLQQVRFCLYTVLCCVMFEPDSLCSKAEHSKVFEFQRRALCCQYSFGDSLFFLYIYSMNVIVDISERDGRRGNKKIMLIMKSVEWIV